MAWVHHGVSRCGAAVEKRLAEVHEGTVVAEEALREVLGLRIAPDAMAFALRLARVVLSIDNITVPWQCSHGSDEKTAHLHLLLLLHGEDLGVGGALHREKRLALQLRLPCLGRSFGGGLGLLLGDLFLLSALFRLLILEGLLFALIIPKSLLSVLGHVRKKHFCYAVTVPKGHTVWRNFDHLALLIAPPGDGGDFPGMRNADQGG